MVVAQIERLLSVAEALARGARVVKSLQKDGNGEAAQVIQDECTKLAKTLVDGSKRRRGAAKRARTRNRGAAGRFN